MKVMLMRMFVLACVLLCGTGVRGQTPNPFIFTPTFSAGAVSGDLNGDGRADIVNYSGIVFLANADGTFTQGAKVSLGNSISYTILALADFTGDGRLDLLLLAQDTFLYVVPGNGDGTFGTASVTNAGTGLGVGKVQVADVNGDGKLDIIGAAASASNGQVFVYLGNGDGTFRGGTPYTMFAGNSIQELIVGDFNGDGKIDIAAAGYTANANGPIGVLLGHGDGAFGTVVTSTGVNSPFGIGVADFNGDGKLDLVVSGIDTSSFIEQTYLLSGNGDGTFQSPVAVAPGNGTVSVADLNGDGKADLIIWATPFIEVFLGSGHGTFTQKATFPNAHFWPLVAVQDFNGDGKLDVSDGFTAIFGNGDGTFNDVPAQMLNIPSTRVLSSVATGDFNSDGKSDLAVAIDTGTPTIFILLGDGTGKYSVGHVYSVSSGLISLQVADLNGDGKADLLFNTGNGLTPGDIGVMLGNGDGTFEPEKISSLGNNGRLQLADFNGDGVPDITTGAQILIGAGDGTFGPPTTYFVGEGANSFGVGDFNGDGKTDLVTCGSAGIGVLLGNGDGTLAPAFFPDPPPPPPAPGPSGLPPTAACTMYAAADFNNDGVTDLLVLQFQAVSMLLGNGDGTFATITGVIEPFNRFSLGAVADFNGDGNLDLIGTDGVTVTFGAGDGTFSGGMSFKPSWIDTRIWENPSDEDADFQGPAVFAVSKFGGNRLPGVAMIVQGPPGGEISLLNPLSPPAPNFILSTTVPAVLAPGGQTTVFVKSNAINGFAGDVVLSCGGLPTGVSCSLASGTIAGGSGQTTLTISTTNLATSGRYPLTVTGTSGAISHDRSVGLTIATMTGATSANLVPASLSYSSHPVGSNPASIMTTLANAGGTTLQISKISIAGANASDFSFGSTCGQSIAAYASCSITVQFAPTGSGVRSAMLVVNDNATGGVQVASLTGSGQDFVVSASSGGDSATVAAGKTATYSLTVGGSSGFSGNVSLSCSGAPTAANCTVSPASVAITNGSAATATVTVTTTARSALTPPMANRDERNTPSIYGSPRVVFYMAILALLIALEAAGASLRRPRLSWAPLAASVLLLAGLAMSGCGGGGTNSSTTPPPSGGTATGTPAGSYTITVTATAGSGANAVSHVKKLTLVVQ